MMRVRLAHRRWLLVGCCVLVSPVVIIGALYCTRLVFLPSQFVNQYLEFLGALAATAAGFYLVSLWFVPIQDKLESQRVIDRAVVLAQEIAARLSMAAVSKRSGASCQSELEAARHSSSELALLVTALPRLAHPIPLRAEHERLLTDSLVTLTAIGKLGAEAVSPSELEAEAKEFVAVATLLGGYK